MKDSPAETGGTQESQWAERFLVNVIWSWLGVIGTFFAGFFLSPYIIRKLGDERYGIWALAFVFTEYFTFFDFGFQNAVVQLVSRARAQNETGSINELINTAFFYFLSIATMLACLSWAVSGYLHYFFHILPAHQEDFKVLVRTVGLGWSCAMGLNVFYAGLEAFQQFKIINRIAILSLLLRSGGCAVVLFLGLGLKTMGVVIMLSQFVTFGLYFLSFRRVFDQLRITPSLVRKSVWKAIAHFGVHSFVAQIGTTLQSQGPPMLIGHFLSEAFVGYYALPNRLLAYVVDLVTRIASITMPNAAEMFVLGKRKHIAEMGMYLNRYCFALFLPFSIFLGIFGRNLIRMWVGETFAVYAAPVLPAFILLTSFAVASQFNSVGILFGMAKHRLYARALVCEALVNAAAMWIVIPRYGIVGAAWIACATAIINRGCITPYILCRSLDLSWLTFMRSIYVSPLLFAIPTVLLGYWLKARVVGFQNWFQLLATLAVLSSQYYAVYFFGGVSRDHRVLVWSWVGNRVRAWRGAA